MMYIAFWWYWALSRALQLTNQPNVDSQEGQALEEEEGEMKPPFKGAPWWIPENKPGYVCYEPSAFFSRKGYMRATCNQGNAEYIDFENGGKHCTSSGNFCIQPDNKETGYFLFFANRNCWAKADKVNWPVVNGEFHTCCWIGQLKC